MPGENILLNLFWFADDKLPAAGAKGLSDPAIRKLGLVLCEGFQPAQQENP
jgi:hypothetical protein